MVDFVIFTFNNTETEFIFSQVFGWTSGVLCFALLIPQLVHIWKHRSAKDLSYWFLSLNQICSFCFVIYALIIGSYPILFSDILIICINTCLIISKVILDKKVKNKTSIQDITSIQDEGEEKEIELTEVEISKKLTEVEISKETKINTE